MRSIFLIVWSSHSIYGSIKYRKASASHDKSIRHYNYLLCCKHSHWNKSQRAIQERSNFRPLVLNNDHTATMIPIWWDKAPPFVINFCNKTMQVLLWCSLKFMHIYSTYALNVPTLNALWKNKYLYNDLKNNNIVNM